MTRKDTAAKSSCHVRQSVRVIGLAAVTFSLVSRAVSLRRRFHSGRVGRVTKAGACLASTLAAVSFAVHLYGPAQIAAAARGANLWLLADAIGLGVLIQIVRAQRSRSLLAQDRTVSLSHSFASMVVGHGIGDLLPLAPGGPVLRSVLTERLAGVPVAFSSGAYMIEGTLDVIAPALLIPYVLLTRSVPSWAHWVMIGISTQAMLLLALLVTLAVHSPAILRQRVPCFLSPGLLHLACQVAEGLRAVTAGGPRRCLLVSGLSLLVLALTAVQLTLFLHAFMLHGPMSGLFMLLVVTLSAGSIPLKIPAFGTMSAAAALPIAGIQGPPVGGYLLVSQFLLSSQTVVLALLVLGWWLVRGTRPLGGVNARRGQSEQPSRAHGLGPIVTIRMQHRASLLAHCGQGAQRRVGGFLLLGSARRMRPVYVDAQQADGGQPQRVVSTDAIQCGYRRQPLLVVSST